WYTVHQQAQRWVAAGVFEQMVDDLRHILRLAAGHEAEPSAVIFDSRTVQSTPESGQDAGFDGAKKRRGRKVHLAVDTLGHLLAAYVTAANEQDRTQVAELAEQVQGITGGTVQVAFVDQGYSGQQAADDAASQAIRLEVIKLPDAKHGFTLLPRRWVIERSIAWLARFRRLARDYERLPQTLAGLHFLAFACLMLTRVVALFQLQAW
ncbi:MAG TPA: IS5 family transposase, partial [Ilumatobacteraceae bacterium]|nr:IS5 family transposase [Ilumatobacteraceae bacterium]